MIPMILKARTDCFSNTTEQLGFDDNVSDPELENIFRVYFGYLLIPFAISANIATPLFIYFVYKAIKTRRVSRKCYILLLNRAVSDQMASLVAILVCAYVILAQKVNRDVVLLMESVFIGSFWTATVSYVALSVLKLLVIWKPLHHRKWFTMNCCLHIVIFSWFIYVFMVSYAAGATAMVKVPLLTEWSGCKIETCLRVMYRSRHFLAVLVYCITLVVFTVTVILIKRGQRNSIRIKTSSISQREPSVQSTGSLLKRQFPLWKLALNILNFAVLHLSYVIWCIYRLTTTDRCFLLTHFMDLIHLLAFIKYTLMLRIIVDPVISFITDSQTVTADRQPLCQPTKGDARISFDL